MKLKQRELRAPLEENETGRQPGLDLYVQQEILDMTFNIIRAWVQG